MTLLTAKDIAKQIARGEAKYIDGFTATGGTITAGGRRE